MATSQQLAMFPMKYLNVTQGYGKGTHVYGYPIDIAGKDSGIENAFSPFDCVVKKIYTLGNTVWFESTSKVKFSNDVVDYAVLMLTHDNDVSNIKVGQRFKQGQVIYQEGTKGPATGNHIHLEVGRGKFRGTGWYNAAPKGKPEVWTINDPVKPDQVFFIQDSTIIKNTGGYKWKKEETDMVTADLVNALVRVVNGRAASDKERKDYVGKETTDKFFKRVLGWGSAKTALEKAKKPADFTNHLLERYRPSHQKYIEGLKKEITTLKAENTELKENQGSVDKETKDKINETNTIVKWIRDLLNKVFK